MYNCIIFIFNLLIFVYFGIFLCHYRRFSVTTNPNIRKEDIIEGHERTKEEGSQRRRTRRLRRQLESVAAGTIVTGYVDRIISEGILVKITSLGSLEVNGLIRKVDLPEQFQVPPGMKESYQTQMLQQDFIPGREITCGVTQVHPNPDDSLVYNVKLMFEDFDGPPVDDVDVTDRFETMSQKERDAVVHNKKFAMTESDDRDTNKEYDDNDDDDTDFEDAFGDYEEEVKNVYEELVANSADGTVLASQQGEKLLKVRDFYDWEPIQDMIKEKSITKNDIDEAIRSVGASKTGTLSLEQFEQVVSELQEQVNESDQGEDTEDEEEMQSKVNKNMRDQDEDDGWGEEAEESNISLTASRTPNNDNEDQDDLNDTDLEDEDDSESTMTAEEDFELAVQDAFDELKSADGRVSVADLKEWKDIKAILDVGAIDMEALDAVIDEVLQQNDKNKKSKKAETMDVAQFKAVMIVLDEIADLSSVDLDEQHQEDEDDMDDERDSRNSQSHVSEGKDQPEQGEGDYDDDDDDDTITEEEYARELEEQVQGVFEELKNTKGKVPVKAFLAYEGIRALVDEGVIEESTIKSMLTDVGASLKGELNFDQLSKVMARIDRQINGLDDDADEPDDDSSQSRVSEGKEQPEQGEGDYDDTGEPDDDEAGGGDSNERVHQLTQSVDEREAHRTVQESNTPTYNNDNNHNGEEEDDELSEKELDEMAKSVFNELLPRGKKTIPFKVFMKWPGITNEISTGMIKENEVLHVLKSVDIKHREELDFDQFLQVMDEIEEIITERGEHDQMDTSTIDNNEEEEEEEGSVSEWGASSQIADGVQARSKGFGSTATGTALSGKETSKHAEIEIQELTQEIYNNLKGKVWNTIVVVCLYMTNNTPT